MAASRIELLASQQINASGNTVAFPVPTLSMAAIGLDITAASGTIALDVWLEGSTDGGSTWFELPCDQVLQSSGVAAENSVATNTRQIVDNKTSTSAEKFLALIKHLAVDVIRLRWTLTGTDPLVTLRATLAGK